MTIAADHYHSRSRTPKHSSSYALSLDHDVFDAASLASGSVSVGGAISLVRELFSGSKTSLSDELSTALEQRLQAIAAPGEAWIDPEVPSDRAITIARALLTRWELSAPRIFPAEGGGVSLEWVDGRQHASVEVNPEGSLYLHVLNLETGNDEDVSESDIDSAIGRLRQWLT